MAFEHVTARLKMAEKKFYVRSKLHKQTSRNRSTEQLTSKITRVIFRVKKIPNSPLKRKKISTENTKKKLRNTRLPKNSLKKTWRD